MQTDREVRFNSLHDIADFLGLNTFDIAQKQFPVCIQLWWIVKRHHRPPQVDPVYV